MQRDELKEILQCLPEYKSKFYYFRDRYALLLLRLAISGKVSKQEIKKTPFSKLLDKAVVQAVLNQCRERLVSANDFDAYWPVSYECFYLTLGVWGSKRANDFLQTSRKGYNLVLQLNFSSKHDVPYRKLVDPFGLRPFELGGHPVAKGELHTLAWSRLDIDLSSGEALIEEIQNDWIREALWARWVAVRQRGPNYYFGSKLENDWIIRYVDTVLRRYEAIWDEAMLAATLWLLREELGVRKVFYHTHASGAKLKKIRNRLPPRSLYTKLPKRFCFGETDEVPELLTKNVRSVARMKVLGQARFHDLKL
ncbi:MAG TPA: hypothetical protein PKH39_00940 [Woeseiaceae bacterium]|nr:hypothetical protein [Woeseiaceae bacterium]